MEGQSNKVHALIRLLSGLTGPPKRNIPHMDCGYCNPWAEGKGMNELTKNLLLSVLPGGSYWLLGLLIL